MIVATDYDPLAHGYVTSLARPSGNVTGVFPQQIELAKKRLQIFTEALPDLQTATMFWDASSEDQWKAMSAAAGGFGLRLVGVELLGERPYDYQAALMQAPLDHRGALITPTSPAFYRDRERLAELALRHRIASIFGFREWVEAQVPIATRKNNALIIIFLSHSPVQVQKTTFAQAARAGGSRCLDGQTFCPKIAR